MDFNPVNDVLVRSTSPPIYPQSATSSCPSTLSRRDPGLSAFSPHHLPSVECGPHVHLAYVSRPQLAPRLYCQYRAVSRGQRALKMSRLEPTLPHCFQVSIRGKSLRLLPCFVIIAKFTKAVRSLARPSLVLFESTLHTIERTHPIFHFLIHEVEYVLRVLYT